MTPGPARPEDLRVPSSAAELPLPRYGSRALDAVVPSVVARLTGRPDDDAVGLALAGDRVLVLVVDGLGSRQLARVPGLAPLLAGAAGGDVDAPFPSTTTASLATLGTGTPPATHGITAYAMPLPGHHHPLAGLPWRVGLRGGGWDAREQVVPESLVPAPTAFERAQAAGVATTVVLDPKVVDSGLTRAALRGGQRLAVRGLAASLDTALAALAEADGPALAYVHHADVDTAGHTGGPCSPRWCDAVADTAAVLGRAVAGLPGDVTVLVTADHGMLDVPEADVLELAEHPDLLDGVRVLAGEPRVRHLALEDDADVEEVATRWRDRLGDRALVVPRADALPWFGPETSPGARERTGDLVVVARRGTLVHEDVDPHGGRHRGQHGGPTTAERLVPLRHLTASDRSRT